MTLHRIEDDLRNHSWYEELFVGTIADIEAYIGRWAAFEQAVTAAEEGERQAPSGARNG